MFHTRRGYSSNLSAEIAKSREILKVNSNPVTAVFDWSGRAIIKAHPEVRQLMVRNPWTALIHHLNRGHANRLEDTAARGTLNSHLYEVRPRNVQDRLRDSEKHRE
jgi:Sphingolipid Delta4-desaturase (DES)